MPEPALVVLDDGHPVEQVDAGGQLGLLQGGEHGPVGGVEPERPVVVAVALDEVVHLVDVGPQVGRDEVVDHLRPATPSASTCRARLATNRRRSQVNGPR